MSRKDVENSIRNATLKMATALEGAAELQVETRYVLTGDAADDLKENEKGRLLARTTIQLDGDTNVVLPMTRDAAGKLQTDKDIFELHQNNVSMALDYRLNLLNKLLVAIRSLS